MIFVDSGGIAEIKAAIERLAPAHLNHMAYYDPNGGKVWFLVSPETRNVVASKIKHVAHVAREEITPFDI